MSEKISLHQALIIKSRAADRTAYHRALEGLFQLGFYTVSTSLDPESQRLRDNTGKELDVIDLPEFGAVRVQMQRCGQLVDKDISRRELVALKPGLPKELMNLVVQELSGALWAGIVPWRI